MLVAPRQQGPGPHAGRIGNATDDDAVAVDAWAVPLRTAGTDVSLVPNAMAFIDMIPTADSPPATVSCRRTDVWIAAVDELTP